jgi:hypothetical protein
MDDVIGTCTYCQMPLVHGVGDESEYPRSVGADGKYRYFCRSSDDGLHHVHR